jgi:hypothetical protein
MSPRVGNLARRVTPWGGFKAKVICLSISSCVKKHAELALSVQRKYRCSPDGNLCASQHEVVSYQFYSQPRARQGRPGHNATKRDQQRRSRHPGTPPPDRIHGGMPTARNDPFRDGRTFGILLISRATLPSLARSLARLAPPTPRAYRPALLGRRYRSGGETTRAAPYPGG